MSRQEVVLAKHGASRGFQEDSVNPHVVPGAITSWEPSPVSARHPLLQADSLLTHTHVSSATGWLTTHPHPRQQCHMLADAGRAHRLTEAVTTTTNTVHIRRESIHLASHRSEPWNPPDVRHLPLERDHQVSRTGFFFTYFIAINQRSQVPTNYISRVTVRFTA